MTSRTRHPLRSAASALLLALFAFGGGGAPVLDAWLHALRGAALVEDAVQHECAWCRLAAAPLAPDPAAPALEPLPALPAAAPARGPHDPPLAPPSRWSPPARAPPAA